MASVLSAAQEKEKGNAAFKAGRFADAVGHYSAAIITDQQDHTLPLNRAAAYLKLSKNRDAERDCSRTLELSKNNVKALYRRAQARIALRNLPEAQLDLENALLLDSGNSAVKDELARIIDLLEKEKAQTHAVTSGIVPPPLQLERPKRRRVPIKIVEPEQTSPVQPTSSSTDLLKLSSSRPLSETPSLVTQPSSALKPADSNAAQQTRAIKSGGGIFRSSGSQQIFTSSSTNMDATVSNKTKTPVPSPTILSAPVQLQDGTQLPLTFFSFARNWNALASPADRWQLLSHISPSVLPSLFQTSLETPLLVSVLSTFQALLTSPMYSHQLGDLQGWIRAYLSAFPRVSRFVTVIMLMNSSERALLQDVLAGVGADEALSASWR